ncbi:MAG: cupin domain-containing protein [Nitrososphaeria archaeon]|nr:cupin domain-containing protein [Nitrososphaeria archaeon]NIN52966.1 cupin domain-containing protein [Nitrososphaeria archaeon]NIQ33525.1 cupin domain-containing protein [Nitrososphaeria archaeon]
MSIYGPGEAATSHAHRGSETMFIVHGRGKFGSPEGVVEVGPGDVLYFRPGEEHYLENTGSQTLEFVYVYADPDDGKALTENWLPLE